MATLLSRSALAKILVFRKKWPFSPSKRICIGFLARIQNQRLKIDPCNKFQLHWTKDKGTRILTWNNTKNGLMTSHLPPSDGVSKIVNGFREILSQSTIMPCLVVTGPQIKEKQGGAQCAPAASLYGSKGP